MSKHTPGEWKVEGEKLKIMKDKVQIASVGVPCYMPNAEANARLISAAPDLLTACQNALIALNSKIITENDKMLLRQAIAKAEGKE